MIPEALVALAIAAEIDQPAMDYLENCLPDFAIDSFTNDFLTSCNERACDDFPFGANV